MNIYDEAQQELIEIETYLEHSLEHISKALERAKKVEELLYWYRESWKTMRDGRLESKINKLEKELEEMK